MRIPNNVLNSWYIKESFWSALSMGANFLIPLASLKLLNQKLDASVYGVVLYVQALVLIICSAVDYGYVISGVREVAMKKDNHNEVAEIIERIQTVRFFLLVLVLLAVVGSTIVRGDSQIQMYTCIASVPAAIGVFLQQTWMLQGLSWFKILAISNVLGKLIYFAAVCLFYVYGGLVSDVLFGFGVSYFFSGLIVFAYLCKRGYAYKVRCDIKSLVKSLKADFFSFAMVLCLSLYGQFVVVLLGAFSTTVYAGIVSTADKIIKAGCAGMGLLSSVLFPRICYELNSSERRDKKFRKTAYIMLGVYVSIAFAVIEFTAPLIGTYFGFASDSGFTPSLRIMALSIPVSLFSLMYGGLGLLTMSADKLYLAAFISAIVVGTCIFFVALYRSMPYFGAVIYAASEILLATAMFYGYTSRLKERFVVN